MPCYEMSLIMKALPKPQLVEALKRSTRIFLQEGGVVQSMENLGERQLPYRIRRRGQWHTHGQYVLVNVDSPVEKVAGMKTRINRDEDVLRGSMLRKEVEVTRPCKSGPCVFGELDKPALEALKQQLRTNVKKL